LLHFYPDQRTILICDFNGFVEPEMMKRRPVVVVSPKRKNGPRACAIIPLSTTPPRPVDLQHCRIKLEPPLPAPYEEVECWVKGDMIYTVSFARLSLPFLAKDVGGKRMYDHRLLDEANFELVQNCVAFSLGLVR
jgi:mRNA interferase MazF